MGPISFVCTALESSVLYLFKNSCVIRKPVLSILLQQGCRFASLIMFVF